MTRAPCSSWGFLLILAPSDDFTAKVIGVSDGDTLTVLKDDKTQVRIRLFGIDAPETGQDHGSRAKQAASDLAFGQCGETGPGIVLSY